MEIKETAATFDTFAAVQDLRTAGFTPAHATAVVETIQASQHSELATKADLLLLRNALQTEMHSLKTAMLSWGLGLAVFIIAAVGLLLRF